MKRPRSWRLAAVSSCQTPSTKNPIFCSYTARIQLRLHLTHSPAQPKAADGPRPGRMLSARPSMADLTLTILSETTDDAAAIERLHARTFGAGRVAKTAYRIREGRGHSLALSFTARIG